METLNFEEILKNKIVNCYNRNTIFDTRNYIDYENAIEVMKEVWNLAIQNVADHTHECGLTNPIIGKPAILKLKL